MEGSGWWDWQRGSRALIDRLANDAAKREQRDKDRMEDLTSAFADKVGSVQLFNLLADWAPDEATRRRILVDNPAALFGF